jgi:hypothetical protein
MKRLLFVLLLLILASAGAGERATFSAAGAATGKYIVHAAAADGKGGIATADLEITVRP